eukprot:s2739_g7.t1
MLGETLEEIDGEIGRLECALRGLQKLEPEVPEHETLVTRTLTLEEVRQDLEAWRDPIRAEFQSLLDHGAIEPISREEVKKLQEAHEVEIIPGKLVAVIKPPFKRKARLVACGNQAYKNEDAEVAAGGLCTISVRSIMSRASQKRWSCATVDVKTAFLQAPRREEVNKLTCVSPPSIAREICGDDLWRVRGALYGLVESPRDWSVYRDGKVKTITWKGSNNLTHRVVPTPEPHVWEIQVEKNGSTETVGYLGIYVDDLLLVGNNTTIHEALEALGKTFTLAAPEFVTSDKTVTFCGYEIKQTPTGFELGQSKYITELLDKHGITEEAWVPCPKIEDGDPEENPPAAALKLAQQYTGELMCVASRTRPDIAYSVGVMSRLLHKRPGYVKHIALQTLKYLRRTTNKTIKFNFCGDENKLKTLEVMVDASFGPPHEGYRSVQGIMMVHAANPLMWASTRQPFVTQSTAEAELLAYNEAYQCGEPTAALLQVLGCSVKRHLSGDSKSGISQLTGDTGVWRTRHLRLRSAKLREVIQDPTEPWSVDHCSGLDLGADGLTKPLQGQAFTRFLDLINMSDDEDARVAKVRAEPADHRHQNGDTFNAMLTGLGAAVMGTGALADSKTLVVCGAALVAASLYRQQVQGDVQHGPQGQSSLRSVALHHNRAPLPDTGEKLCPGQVHLPGDHAELSRSQPEIHQKEKEKSLKTTRLAKRPHKDHKDGQPQKGNLDEAAHPPNPQSRASTANENNQAIWFQGSQSLISGKGGVLGFRATDRPRTLVCHGTGKGLNAPMPSLKALCGDPQNDPWGVVKGMVIKMLNIVILLRQQVFEEVHKDLYNQ